MGLSEKLLQRLKSASSMVVLTGAGMSAASGIPTFRGKDGLWNKYDPHELASLPAFLQHPERVWEWYRWRRGLVRQAKPNPGHFALTEIAAGFPEYRVITQNVDGLHQRAGTPNITELHGNILRTKCIDCTYERESDPGEDAGPLPKCPRCGNLLRPAVVWFGETLPAEALHTARECAAAAEIFLSVGTSALVEPAASLPLLARANGAFVIEVNPEETPLSPLVDQRFAVPADAFLPAFAQVVKKIRKCTYSQDQEL